MLSLLLYTTDESKFIESDAVIPFYIPKQSKPQETTGEVAATSDHDTFLKSLTKEAKACFDVLHEHMYLTQTEMKEIFEKGGRSSDALLLEMYKCLFDTKLTGAELLSLATERESMESDRDDADDILDTGVIQFSMKMPFTRPPEEAKEEVSDGNYCLMHAIDNETRDKLVQKQRVRSAKLLKQQLEACKNGMSRKYLYKVNLALTILYARHLLAEVLAAWPVDSDAIMISGKLLGCSDDSEIACVLDLLHNWDNGQV